MRSNEDNAGLPPVARLLLAIGMVAIGLVLAWALWSHSETSSSLAAAVMTELPRSGVSNPVTAVLLNFRAFDTMLELAVLLLVAVTVGGLRDPREVSAFAQVKQAASVSPLLQSLARDLVPIMMLTSGYLLWIGAKAPGGAFQAGAVLAAAAVLAHLSGRPWLSNPGDWRIRALLVLGTGAFLVSALALLLVTGTYFRYPPALAGAWILIIETAATLSIAAMLYVTFCAVVPMMPSRR
ncbi:multisubunit sodium/proton antiporter, MrpB subunit [Modicisalibacter ilicicola DSM 19980]|uniref:Multisubunit sodium/proton antiporter, MrpB subunit n=1 Tax=Modicisalibacter ilicicola DSM 19980 TaxID=1121942 RepID=A0A1M4ZQC2_9GAMM|nr:hydrogen gas-evolving membrane-bound hydrogenase subunit E [Halomonas ilicicola]SHF20194.1 multisubunit sodium/proton antiporter, MrpB subunit [Halomonas ilicicola DSM 19980]